MSRPFAPPTPDAAGTGFARAEREGIRFMARRGVQLAIANVGIAGIVLLVHGGAWLPTLVYSECIGLSCWILIAIGRRMLPRDEDSAWPRDWRTPVLFVGACAAGFASGTTVADAVLGHSSWPILLASPRDLLGGLALTGVFSSIVIGWFFTRGRAQAQAVRLAAMKHEATLANLTLLQSQLEPHMLFNTLANLRALIATDPDRAQEMLDRLIGFLRATLVASRAGPHPLAAEFDRVEDYLALMQVRMGARLRVTISLPPELADATVPPLLLQPLVENAIKHGLEPRRGPGELAVSAHHAGDRLVLRVEDGAPDDPSRPVATGVGPEPADLTPGRPRDAAPTGTGFGLAQVRERIRHLYGDAASLSLAPGRRGGWCAEIQLPLTSAGPTPGPAR